MKKLNIKTEEQKEMTRFLVVLIGLILIIVGIYFFTRVFVTKDLFTNKDNSDSEYTTGVVDNTAAIVGNMLNRSETEYYVALLNYDNPESYFYNTLISNYSESENALKFYYVDLTNSLNKKYLATEGETISTNYKDLDSLKLGDITIIRVKKGKVVKFLIDEDSIRKELNVD